MHIDVNAERTRNNQSIAAANQRQRRTHGRESTSGFVDNRAESARLRKLQATVDNSPQSMRMQTVQCAAARVRPERLHTGRDKPLQLTTLMPLAAVVQRAVLATDQLNVVGEEHPETAARLNNEKAFAKHQSGSSNYWTEGQFRVRAYSVLTDILEDKRAKADPFRLRFNHAQAFLRDNADILKGHGDRGENDEGRSNELDNQVKFIRNLDIYLSNLAADTEGFALSVPERTTILGTRAQINNIAATFEAARTELAHMRSVAAPAPLVGFAGAGTAVTTEAHGRANLKKAVDALQELNPVGQKAEISTARSAAMHTAANARHTEKGVWKVGEKHRKDMSREDDRNYNLVSRGAFNKEYVDWLSEKMLGKRDTTTGQYGMAIGAEAFGGL